MIFRATILLVGSQIIYLLSSFFVNIGLARMLGPSSFGVFGLVISILVVAELFVITGIPEAIQKFGSVHVSVMRLIIRETMAVQIIYTISIFLIFWMIAAPIASFFGDSALRVLLRIAGFDIIFLGLYKYVLAIQNGLRWYSRYAILNIVYSITRFLSILGLVYLGFSLKGALIGNFLCSLVALLVGLWMTRLPETNENPQKELQWKPFIVQNVLYFVALNMLFAVDVWFVKYFLADVHVGEYVSAANLSKLIYFLSIAISAVLLPEVARSYGMGNRYEVGQVVRNFLRWLFVLASFINTVVWLNAKGIILLLYGSEYQGATPILKIVFIGYTLITLAALIHTILIAQDRMFLCFVLVLSMLLVDIFLNFIFVPHLGTVGAGVAAVLTGTAGFAMGSLFIRDQVLNIIFSGTSVRIALAIGISVLITLVVQTYVSSFIVHLFVTVLSFVGTLVLSGEVTKREVGEMVHSLLMAK
jgi:O-antigen/teichoic acid export membrane protein